MLESRPRQRSAASVSAVGKAFVGGAFDGGITGKRISIGKSREAQE